MESRYARQALMDEIGPGGQKKLKDARVLVVGAGGLGCPVLTYLACAGVGFLRIADDDVISESNLNRQFLYGPDCIGNQKALMAKESLIRQNPDIKIDALFERVSEENAQRMLEGIHMVVDCVDNAKTRLIMNSACMKKGIPLVEGGVEGFYGFATVVKRNCACLECMGYREGEAKAPVGVIGVTAGIIGMIQANECIRMILGLESALCGKILQYDGHHATTRNVDVKIDPNCGVHKRFG